MHRFKNFNLGNLKNAGHSGSISFVYNCITIVYRSGICYKFYYFILFLSILIFILRFIYFWFLNESMNESGMKREWLKDLKKRWHQFNRNCSCLNLKNVIFLQSSNIIHLLKASVVLYRLGLLHLNVSSWLLQRSLQLQAWSQWQEQQGRITQHWHLQHF